MPILRSHYSIGSLSFSRRLSNTHRNIERRSSPVLYAENVRRSGEGHVGGFGAVKEKLIKSTPDQ